MHHNRTVGLGSQYIGVKIKNNTSDILRVQLEYYCDLVCGERHSQNIGFGEGISIKPGETIGAKGFWDSDNTSFDAGNRRSSSCMNSQNKSKKVGENDFTAIQSVGYRLLSIENVSEKKRQEDAKKEAEARKKKEEEERLRLEREAAAKKKKEDDERARLEREATEKKKQEEEEKQRLAKAEAKKQQSQNSGGQASAGYGLGSGSSSVAASNASQNRQTEYERQRQLQIQRNEEQKRQQQLAQEEAERKRKQQFEEMQAKIAENNRKREALNTASQETMTQWSQGNYLQGSTALATEYAVQGKSDAALTTLAVGTGLEIINMIGEEKRRKEEAEARAAERARIAEEERRRLARIEEEKRQILEQQKREFNQLVEENRAIKKSIIKKRDQFLDSQVNHTPTFDMFADDESPIYIFYVQSDIAHDYYREKIDFPNQIEIYVNENAKVHFSPIMTILPNSSGEYPYIKEILSEIETKHIDASKGKYKVYNWSNSLEELQTVYNKEAVLAGQAYFSVVFPDEPIIEFSDKDQAKEDENAIDYWNSEISVQQLPKKEEQINKEETKETKKEEVDYWSLPTK